MNIFKRFLRKELGKTVYERLAASVTEPVSERVLSERLYSGMYERLISLESEKILMMQQRLNEVLLQAFRVSKTYSLVFFIYLAAWFFLLGADLYGPVLIISIITISGVFVGKTLQFLSNRCEYVDARLIETYKTVMDKILKTRMEAYEK